MIKTEKNVSQIRAKNNTSENLFLWLVKNSYKEEFEEAKLKYKSKPKDEIDVLKEDNFKLKRTINYFENLFDRLVIFIKKRIFGNKKIEKIIFIQKTR